MKQLPKPKKNLKNFILGEDAKIIDKTVVKISLIASSLIILAGCSSGGGGCTNTHNNLIHYEGNDANLGNDGETNYNAIKSAPQGNTLTVNVPPKTIQTVHANHYNCQ